MSFLAREDVFLKIRVKRRKSTLLLYDDWKALPFLNFPQSATGRSTKRDIQDLSVGGSSEPSTRRNAALLPTDHLRMRPKSRPHCPAWSVDVGIYYPILLRTEMPALPPSSPLYQPTFQGIIKDARLWVNSKVSKWTFAKVNELIKLIGCPTGPWETNIFQALKRVQGAMTKQTNSKKSLRLLGVGRGGWDLKKRT